MFQIKAMLLIGKSYFLKSLLFFIIINAMIDKLFQSFGNEKKLVARKDGH